MFIDSVYIFEAVKVSVYKYKSIETFYFEENASMLL
jgi:hypothetical protein